MDDDLKLCVIGGSNSLVHYGYVAPLVTRLENKTGRHVTLRNVSAGGTFSQFGLWQAATKHPHKNADVIIVEYALDDRELEQREAFSHWRKSYEGLIRRLRKEAPKAQIICPILTHQKDASLEAMAKLALTTIAINSHYGVESVDVQGVIGSMAPEKFWVPAEEWYKEPSHYSKPYQAILAGLIVDAICSGRGSSDQMDVAPIHADHFEGARSAAEDGLLDLIMPSGAERILFENDKVKETGIKLTSDCGASFALRGEIVALIIMSTVENGVLAYHHGDHSTFTSLFRKALVGSGHGFLLDVVIPDQSFGKTLGSTKGTVDINLSVCNDYAQEDIPKSKIHIRGSSTLPPTWNDRSICLVDLLYVGSLSE